MKIDPLFHPELLHASVFVADNATVLGEVRIDRDSSVWFGAVVRGDSAAIQVGSGCNIQDLAILHADQGLPCQMADRVTIGHAAIVHGATISDEVMIGMRAVVLNEARIGSGCIIAAGSIVTEGTQIPAGSVVMGMPGRVVRSATDEDRKRIRYAAEHYQRAAQEYLQARRTAQISQQADRLKK